MMIMMKKHSRIVTRVLFNRLNPRLDGGEQNRHFDRRSQIRALVVFASVTVSICLCWPGDNFEFVWISFTSQSPLNKATDDGVEKIVCGGTNAVSGHAYHSNGHGRQLLILK